MKKKLNYWNNKWAGFFALSLFLTACGEKQSIDPTTGDPLTEHYWMGNPSKATKLVSNTDNFLLEKKQFVLSYNNTFGRANWVSWRLAKEWLGNVPRHDVFSPDNDLPTQFYRPGTQAFSLTGFDRGHLCPSADRDATNEDNIATFVMSNILAQAPKVNQGNWADLETYCRKLVEKEGKELYIIAGGYGEGGSGSNGGTTKKIDNGRIRVPSNNWKIVVVLPEGSDDVSRIDANTRVIAIDIPNKQSSGSDSWGNYRISVRDLEATTTYDFLSQLPKNVQDAIEKTIDKGPTQ